MARGRPTSPGPVPPALPPLPKTSLLANTRTWELTNDQYLNGNIDEMRLSNAPRSSRIGLPRNTTVKTRLRHFTPWDLE